MWSTIAADGGRGRSAASSSAVSARRNRRSSPSSAGCRTSRGQQPGEAVDAAPADQVPDQPADRREREPFGVQLHAGAAQDLGTCVGQPPGALLQQPGLADPGFPAEDDDLQLAGPRAACGGLDEAQFRGPADERRPALHGGKVRPPARDERCRRDP